ncbi:MAG: GldG family protein, partial [Saprospiraceae bacterium]|nr:GldG family protein [Saprospiraceae bacterium]
MVQRKDTSTWIHLVAILGTLLLVNVAGEFYYAKLDLTEEKRFTLTDATTDLIEGIQQPVFVEVLLDGKFPAGFKRLQNAVRELLTEYKSLNNKIQFRFEDPLEGAQEVVNQRLQTLAQVGIVPTELNVKDREGSSKKRIYPYAIFNYSDRQVAINLL